MKPYYQDSAITIYLGDCLEVIPELESVDHVITDPPFSEKTQKGHNCVEGIHGRRGISYDNWDFQQIKSLVEIAHPLCKGWFVVMTDHILSGEWENCLKGSKRYTFPPLPFVSKGSRFRLLGDGPASWTVWIVVARPKRRAFIGWGSLPGAYVLPLGEGKSYPVVGGKPDWLMRQLVADYSREGDTILDFCMGAGTTLRAAKDLGRKAIGIEIDETRCEIAAQKMAQEVLPLQIPLEPDTDRTENGQLGLFSRD